MNENRDEATQKVNDLYNKWCAIDMRKADEELDGQPPREAILIMEGNADGGGRIIARIANDNSGLPLTDEDAENAIILARAPVMLSFLKTFGSLIEKGKPIPSDAVFMDVLRFLVKEIHEGEIYPRVEFNFEEMTDNTETKNVGEVKVCRKQLYSLPYNSATKNEGRER